MVDDQADLGDFYGDLLRMHGYRVTVMTDSRTALSLFKGKPDEFALVLTDQTMPGMTGLDLLGAVRDIRPGFPVILSSGFSEDVDEARAAAMGVRYLAKPVRAGSLIQAVGELLTPAAQGPAMPPCGG